MKLISYKAAKIAGLTRYFTGSPCCRGHIAERRTVNRSCVACIRADAADYYQKNRLDPEFVAKNRERSIKWQCSNKERYAARLKKWVEANHEKRAYYNRTYHSANKDRISEAKKEKHRKNPHLSAESHRKRYQNPKYVAQARARTRQWRIDHPERFAENQKKWRARNPDRVQAIKLAGCANRRAREAAAGKVKAMDIRAIRSANQCALCGRRDGPMEIDHIMPLSRGGLNHRDNLQLLCRPCNRRKWARLPTYETE